MLGTGARSGSGMTSKIGFQILQNPVTHPSPVFRIRILIGSGFNQVRGSGSRRAKITKKIENFLEISCF
jgi:hypothetical protein